MERGGSNNGKCKKIKVIKRSHNTTLHIIIMQNVYFETSCAKIINNELNFIGFKQVHFPALHRITLICTALHCTALMLK